MKKSIRYILGTVLAVMLLCMTLALVACGGEQSDITKLEIENAKISFMCGDVFETGDDFKVYATYKNGKVEDVTDRATVRQERDMDMTVAGDYQITVSFGGKRVIYTVYVNDSADVLRKIELDTTAVKTQYKLGDKVSLDWLALNLTYENAQKVMFTVKSTSLSDFNVSITGENGNEITDVFTSLGTFTVTVSRGNVKASFNMTVDSVNISSVQSAIAVGGYYSGKVASGEMLVQGAHPVYSKVAGSDGTMKPMLPPHTPVTTFKYDYEFGNNYAYFKERSYSFEAGGNETPEYKGDVAAEVLLTPIAEYHSSMDGEGFFVTQLNDGVIGTPNRNNSEMMGGAPVLLWYSSETEYGVESTLNNLYTHALRSSNKDLKETVDESTKTYTFEFSGLEQRESKSDYYETTVTFRLGENYEISYVKITQNYYENNSSLAGRDDYVPTFTTDAAGKTTPTGDYSYRTVITVNQTAGERTAQNSYGRDMFKITSYKLMYDGKELKDNAVMECVAGEMYTLTIADMLPETANLAMDMMLFDYEGNFGNAETWLNNEHFGLSRSGNQITLSTKHGGTWTILIKTEKTTKRIVVNILGNAPEADMQPKLLNGATGKFYDGNDKTLAVGDAVYFYGAVEQYANGAQTATVTSDNAEFATITKDTKDGVDCWKFTATKEGAYQVTVVSDVASRVRCIFNFTVTEIDFSGLLVGTYTVQDRVGDIYTVTFTQGQGETVGGTVSVTRTPTDENDNPLNDQAVTQTFTFGVEGTTINIEHKNDDKLWVEFEVDENNNLVLIDQREQRYILSKN